MSTERTGAAFVPYARLGAVLCLLAASVTACASRAGQETPDHDAARDESAASPSAEEAVDARALIRQALKRWQEADTWGFAQAAEIPGFGSMRVEGVFQLSTRSTEGTQIFDTQGDEPLELRYLAIKDVGWMNSQGWEDGLHKCWLRFDAGAIQESTGMAIEEGGGGLPGNAVALSYAEGTRVDPSDPEVVIGTVDLISATSMFGSGVLKALQDTTIEAPVEAEFTLVDGVIDSWSISGQSMAAALEREGALGRRGDDLLAAISSYDVTVDYSELDAAEVNVRPPDPALQMTPAQSESGVGCPAVQ
jgi:hypothetical protein